MKSSILVAILVTVVSTPDAWACAAEPSKAKSATQSQQLNTLAAKVRARRLKAGLSKAKSPMRNKTAVAKRPGH